MLYHTWSALAQGVIYGLLLALGVRILLALASPILDASARFAIWFATLLAIVSMPFLFMLPHATARAKVFVMPLRLDDGAAYSGLAVFLSVLLLLRLVFSYLRICRLKRDAVEAPPEAVERFRAWGAQLRPGRSVDLVISRRASSPMAVGFCKPAIVLPESLLLRLTTEEFDHLGLHELAHIARRDDWMNLTERILQALYFWHPAVFWVCRRLELERELACDDAVVVQSGGEPKRYARSLARVIELAPWSRGPVLASGAVFRKRQILQRIETLMASAKNARPRVSSFTVVVIVMCVFGALGEFARMPQIVAFDSLFSGPGSRWRWSDNGRTVEMQTSGEVQFSVAEPDVEAISPGGFVRLHESGWTSRDLEWTPSQSGSGIAVRYRVDGREMPLDNIGKDWSKTTLLWAIRESGINAEERVGLILGKKGVPAVLEEVDRIGSDNVRRRYLTALLDSALEPADQVRAIQKIAKLKSDHEKAELLLQLRDRATPGPLRAAWLESARSIHSDHDKARVLRVIEEEAGGEKPVADDDLLRSVRTIESDHDKANVLQRLAAGPYSPEFLTAVGSIASDHDKSRVIGAMLQSGGGSVEAAQAAVSLARGIASDHEKAELLRRVLDLHGDKPEIRAQVRKAAEKIASDSEYRRVVSKIQFEVQCKDGPSCG
jgi:hypothetical protein